MKHSKVINKWKWRIYIEKWMNTAECVWWVKLYWAERWFSIKAFWWSAINWWNTWCPFDDYWERVVKTPFNSPSEWDIIFWSEKRCKNGHVSVANNLCNLIVLRHIDQNWTGKQDKIQPRWSNYSNVLWWFHKL